MVCTRSALQGSVWNWEMAGGRSEMLITDRRESRSANSGFR